MLLRILLVLFAALSACVATHATETVDFESQIRPLFARHCSRCHGAEKQESGLRLDRRDSLLRGGDFGGAAVVAGDPENSYLLHVVSGKDPDVTMPPDTRGLTKADVDLLTHGFVRGLVGPGR